MYLRVLRDARLSKGHPVVKHCLTHDMGEVPNYFSIVKAKVLAPSGLYLPLLPYRFKTFKKFKKLTFTNCAMCADLLYPKTCKHNESQRAFVGVYTTVELEKAIGLGYKILEFYQVWHYEKSCQYNAETGEQGIFSEYVNTFHRLKTASSGYPVSCTTYAEKLDYPRTLEKGDHIKLNLEEVKENPRVRSVAKFLSNNIWGDMLSVLH